MQKRGRSRMGGSGLGSIVGRRSPILLQLICGGLAALMAIALRLVLPLKPEQLPTLTVLTAIAFLTPFVGFWAGVACAVIGGALAFYFFFNPHSWSLANGAAIPLIGYIVLALVILLTSQLYAASERRRRLFEIEALESEAERARFFARELAHRSGNALTIVQSVAVQTLGSGNPLVEKFSGRLKALGDANKLLTEHVESPTAQVREIIEAAVDPFADESDRISIKSCDGILPSQSALSLALAIHELATNAVKHGALSSPGGTVEISCTTHSEYVEVAWVERGGSPLSPASEQGFGLKLLRRLGGSIESFDETGLKCTVRLRR